MHYARSMPKRSCKGGVAFLSAFDHDLFDILQVAVHDILLPAGKCSLVDLFSVPYLLELKHACYFRENISDWHSAT